MEEVLTRMKEYVGPKRYEKFVRVDKNIFSGRLIDNKFHFRLNKDYRNSWTPEVIGTIVEEGNNVDILVTLKSNFFVIAFTTVFILIGLAMLITQIIYFTDMQDFEWTSVLFLIFPYALCWFGFNLDADKSIDGLIKIAKGEIK